MLLRSVSLTPSSIFYQRCSLLTLLIWYSWSSSGASFVWARHLDAPYFFFNHSGYSIFVLHYNYMWKVPLVCGFNKCFCSKYNAETRTINKMGFVWYECVWTIKRCLLSYVSSDAHKLNKFDNTWDLVVNSFQENESNWTTTVIHSCTFPW